MSGPYKLVSKQGAHCLAVVGALDAAKLLRHLFHQHRQRSIWLSPHSLLADCDERKGAHHSLIDCHNKLCDVACG